MISFLRKKTILFLLIILLVVGNNFFAIPSKAQNNLSSLKLNSSQLKAPLKLLVKYKNNSQIYKFSYSNERELEKAWKEFKNNPEVEIVERDKLFRATYLPNDPLYLEEWFLKRIRAPQAWDLTRGGSSSVVVAVLDTGVDINHPDLKDNIWVNKKEIPDDGLDNDNNGYVDDVYGWDFISGTNDPRPRIPLIYNEGGVEHGTIIAGLIAAVGDNAKGIVGLSYQSKIMPLRVLDSQGIGDMAAVIEAIDYAIKEKVDVINLSFVGSERSELLYQTIKRAYQSGIVVVAAAGNDSLNHGDDLDKNPVYPICLDENDKDNFILGVAALNKKNKKADFSNFGEKCIDISAPGTKIYSTLAYDPGNGFTEYYGGYWSGTSVAAPLVAGTAALIKSINPLLPPDKIIKTIKETADKIDAYNPKYKDKLGAGRLNTYQAVRKVYQQMKYAYQARYILTGAGKGGGPHLRMFKSNSLPLIGFFAYDKKFRGGIMVASGDVNGDGQEEILTGAGKGGGPHLRIFSQKGKFINHFFAYEKNFHGGINLAAGDLDNDGIDEIIVAPQSDYPPLVRVFDFRGNLKVEFYAYSPKFRGGVSLTVGDIDGDGRKEIITGALSHGGPQVRIFDKKGKVKSQFFAYLESFHGGINVAAGDIDRDNKDEIVVSIASGASPYIRVFDNQANLLAQFLAYDRDFYHGVNIACADLDNDGKAEIITGPRSGGGPQVRILDYQGRAKSQFFAYAENFHGGLSVATIKANGK